jgi:hypothetical protein
MVRDVFTTGDSRGTTPAVTMVRDVFATGGNRGTTPAARVRRGAPATGVTGGRAAVDAAAAACKTRAEKIAVYDAARKESEDDAEYYKTRITSVEFETTMLELPREDMRKWMELMSKCRDVNEVAKLLEENSE